MTAPVSALDQLHTTTVVSAQVGGPVSSPTETRTAMACVLAATYRVSVQFVSSAFTFHFVVVNLNPLLQLIGSALFTPFASAQLLCKTPQALPALSSL